MPIEHYDLQSLRSDLEREISDVRRQIDNERYERERDIQDVVNKLQFGLAQLRSRIEKLEAKDE